MVHEDEDERTLKVGSRGKSWDVPFAEPFDLLCCRFRRTERGIQRTEKTLSKGMGSWWRDGFIRRATSVSLSRKCERVVSHFFSTALGGSVKRLWRMKEY